MVSWASRRLAVAGAVLAAAVVVTSPPSSARAEDGGKVVLVGLDGADWRAIDSMVARGELPTFARLKAQGRTGILLSTPPLLSPIVWTTIATGRTPDDHGVLDFMVDLPGGGQRPVSVRERRVPALWNLFSAAGRSVAVVGWWATAPAEDVRGTIVSDRVAPQLTREAAGLVPGSVSPAAQAARLSADLVPISRISLEDLRAYVPISSADYAAAQRSAAAGGALFYRDPIAHLAAVVAATHTYGAMAERLMRPLPPDLLAVYLEEIDTLSHRFVRDRRRGPAALARAYRDADDLIARLAALSAPDALVIVCSDHGFHPPEAGVTEDPADLAGPASAWHRPYGIVAAAEAGVLTGRATGTAADAGVVTPLDIAPTVLHAAGLAVPREMPGRAASALLPADAARPVVRAPTPAWTPPAEVAGTTGADPDAITRLRALGYVGGATTSLARLNLGEVLYRRGRLDAAERELRAVVEAQPTNLAAALWWARTVRDLGRSEQALRAYAAALKLPGDVSEAAVEAAELAASSGHADEGRRLAALVPAISPGAATARGVLSAAAGDAAAAEREYRAALARDPAFFPALFRLVEALVASNRASDAVVVARAGAAKAPASPRHVALLGDALLASRDARGAEAALGQALALAPDATAVRIDLARAQLAQGRAKEAEAALAGAPESVERTVLLGAVASTQGRWAEAAARYESALAGGPATPELLNGLGWARFKLGEPDRAADVLRRSLALKRDQPEIRRLLAEVEASRPAR